MRLPRFTPSLKACLWGVLLCFLGGKAAAAEPATLVWIGPDLPPISIWSGQLIRQGFVDLIVRDLIAQLPEFRHQFVGANYERVLTEIRNQPNVCSGVLLKTAEREAYIRYSEPYLVALTYGLITATPQADARLRRYADDKGQVVLTRAVADGAFQVGVPFGRTFGPQYARLIEAERGKPGLFVRQGEVGAKGLLEMLLSGRIDAMIGYPTEVSYVARELGVEAARLGFHPLQGGDPATLMYVGCSRSPLGEQVVARLNVHIVKNREHYAQIYEGWLSEAARSRYRREVRPLLK